MSEKRLFVVPAGLDVSIRAMKDRAWRGHRTSSWLLFPGEYRDRDVFSSGGAAIFCMHFKGKPWLLLTRHEQILNRLPDGEWQIEINHGSPCVGLLVNDGDSIIESAPVFRKCKSVADLRLPAKAHLLKSTEKKQKTFWDADGRDKSKDYLY